MVLALCGCGLAGGAENAGPATMGVNARMLRYPDVSATQIAFVYAGDIWVVPKAGGVAQRLSSPKGEESFPRFSPDGTRLAFSGNYDGNLDLYVMPVSGGLPTRLTFHGAPDRMLEWYPDGKSILFATSRTSEKDRFNQLYRISAEGGLPEKLPMPYGEFGAIAPDCKTLAYVPVSTDFRTWKRYRGGMNPAIWLFDLETLSAHDITGNDCANSQPMWHGTTLYFLSDRDANKRANIWACETRTKQLRQVTHFEELDVHFPNIGPSDLVFECGGRLYLMDLATEKYAEVRIEVVTDLATLKPRLEDVSKLAREPAISPSGKRAVLQARGDVFTVPAEHGVVRNLTQSSGLFEREPAWSPDGKTIAYFSDRTGEYELTVRPADGSGQEETLTKLGPGFRYRPFWSPDSRKLVFIDKAMQVWLHDLDKKETRMVDKQMWLYSDDLKGYRFGWSLDSRWVAFAHDLEQLSTAIALYDTREGKLHVVTSGYYQDQLPVFDPNGKYLFYRTGREFTPVYSDLDETWIYPNSRRLAAVPLRKDVASPLAPRNDEEGGKESDKAKDKKKVEQGDEVSADSKAEPKKDKAIDKKAKAGDKARGEVKSKTSEDSADSEKEEPEEKAPKPVEIELAGFESRVVLLPPKAGAFEDLAAADGKLIYRRLPRAGAAEEKSTLAYYDLEEREEKAILEDADEAILAAKGEKLLVRRKDDYAIIEPKEDQKFEKKISLAGLEAVVDPRAEWRQIFDDVWRYERDYFYDPNMHGVDWKGMRVRYGELLKDAVTRWDVNYVLGEMIAELNSSHTYRGGGDLEQELKRGVGYLGADFSLENGAYRFKKIIDGASWDAEVRSPLRRPGLDVKEGDYLLAVNGMRLDTHLEPYAAFQGLSDQPVFLTINDKPSLEGSREVLVQTLAEESRLRHLAWIEKNRRKVEELSGGRIGYVYVADTGRHGQSEMVRQFRAQYAKPGMIIDERFNSGGQATDRFVELLARKTLNYWGVRDGHDAASPAVAHSGPKAMLINGWSGSGGDCFPFHFRQAGLGPLIGTRTWGGLIGITGNPDLVDAGGVTVPTFGIYSTNGDWIIEGHGVEPDIKVVDDPSLMAKGGDPQLERAVAEVLKALDRNPPQPPRKPEYPKRAGR
jgi:tricorn protease